jgi:hypothetical protein
LSANSTKKFLPFSLGGSEYKKLNSFFTKVGIAHHVSCPHTHQQNGLAERKHRHVVEVGLSLLARASMPLKFWDEAFTTTAYLINRLPSHVINFDTPLHRLYDTTPDYSFLKVFECACWPNLRLYNQHKLQFWWSRQCAFLGYSSLHKGYKCLDIQTGHVYVSHNVVFDEEVFPFANLHPNAGSHPHSELLLLHPTLLPNRGLNLAHNHVANAPNLFGENESLQMSTGYVENSEYTCDHASGSNTGCAHVTEDPGARSYGDSPRIAEDQGAGAASGLVLDSLDGAPTMLSLDPMRDPPSGVCLATTCQHPGVHSSKATMTSATHPAGGVCPAARSSATGVILAPNLPGGACTTIDGSPQHQRSVLHLQSSSTIVPALSRSVTRFARGIVQPRNILMARFRINQSMGSRLLMFVNHNA